MDIAGGWWVGPPERPRQVVGVKDFQEARSVFTSWRDDNHLGGGNMACDCGAISETSTGKTVARISFNGRVWTPERYPDCQEIPIESLSGKSAGGKSGDAAPVKLKI